MAGIKNIISFGFGVQGQVNLIEFQSMPDGLFKFLLNYINHGCFCAGSYLHQAGSSTIIRPWEQIPQENTRKRNQDHCSPRIARRERVLQIGSG